MEYTNEAHPPRVTNARCLALLPLLIIACGAAQYRHPALVSFRRCTRRSHIPPVVYERSGSYYGQSHPKFTSKETLNTQLHTGAPPLPTTRTKEEGPHVQYSLFERANTQRTSNELSALGTHYMGTRGTDPIHSPPSQLHFVRIRVRQTSSKAIAFRERWVLRPVGILLSFPSLSVELTPYTQEHRLVLVEWKIHGHAAPEKRWPARSGTFKILWRRMASRPVEASWP